MDLFNVCILNLFVFCVQFLLYRMPCRNCEVGELCGVIMHGGAVTFCDPYGPRELVSLLLIGQIGVQCQSGTNHVFLFSK